MASPRSAGTLRRAYTRVQEAVGDWLIAARSDLAPVKSTVLHKFETADDVGAFQVTTDKVLGGNTSATFSLKPYEHFRAGIFQGAIDYRDENPQSRGGFASFRTKPDERERDLSTFEAIEMRVKTDGRPYIFNLKCSEFSSDFLWQMRIITEPSKWVTVAMPLRELVLTRRGRIEVVQLPVPREVVNGFGVLLADGQNGPFKFEVQELRAVNHFDPASYANRSAQVLEANLKHQQRLAAAAESAEAEAKAGLGKPQRTSEELKEHYRKEREDAKLR